MDRSLYYAARSIVSQGGKGRREGETKGHAKGLSEGLSKGEAKGRSESLKEGAIQTARRMKAKGLALEFISEMTGLSSEEIASL